MVLNALTLMNVLRVTTNVMLMLSAATKMGATTVTAKQDIAVMDLSAVMSMNVQLTINVTRRLHVVTQMAASHANVTKDTMVMESFVLIKMNVVLTINALHSRIALIFLVDILVSVKPALWVCLILIRLREQEYRRI